jgi:hypothetical protein
VAPTLVTDLPVLAALVVSWSLVPVVWAHVATGLGLVGLVVVHLRTRRWPATRMRRRPRSSRRAADRAMSWALVTAVAAVTGTGLLRLVGASPEETWHGGTGYVLLAAVALHLWSVRRRLRVRLHRDGSTR